MTKPHLVWSVGR